MRPPAHDASHLHLVARVVRRRWKVMLCAFVLVGLPLMTYTVLFEKKTYEATATLFVDSTPEEYALIKDWIPGSDIPLQMAVLRSRSLAELVVDSLPRESIEELLKESMYRDYLLDVANSIRRLLRRELIVYSPKERAVMELQHARTTFTVKGSQVEIKSVATRPKVSMDLANTYVEILLNRSRSYVREEARAAREFLEAQLTQAQETLKDHEERLARARRSGGGLGPSHRTELDLTRLAQAEAALAEAQLAKKFAESRVGALRAQLEKTAKAEDAERTERDPATAQRLRERRAQLEERLTMLLERYTEQHPIVIATRSEIRELRQRLEALPAEPRALERPAVPAMTLKRQIADLEQELAAVGTREEMLEQRVASVRRSFVQSGGAEEIEQSRLVRAVEGQRNFASLLIDKLTAARIREQGDVKSLRVIDLATLPMAPSGSRATKRLAMALLFSIAISAVLGAVLEVFRDPIEFEDDVASTTGLPVLAFLPAIDLKKLAAGDPISVLNLWDEPAVDPAFAERCRGLALLLEAMGRERPLRSVLVASAAPEEGKSTVLVNLAWACAELGKRLVVVDSDLRRPALCRILGIGEGAGLTEALSGSNGDDPVLVPFREKASVLRSGARHPSPQSLLASSTVEGLLARLHPRGDLLLFDSAPLNVIADNLKLAARVDGVILVARAGETQKRELARAKAELERFGATVLGVVLNALPPSSVRQYYGKYSSYYTGASRQASARWTWRPWAFAARRRRQRHGDGVQ